MRFTATFPGLVLLLSSASARPSIQESCGAGAQVIDKKTLVTSSGREITFTTTSCPGFAALRNATSTPSTVHKRQESLCPVDCTSFECETTALQPAVADCDNLTSELLALDETFSLPPQTEVQVELGTCSYIMGNFDTITYDICTGGFGALGENAVTHCFVDVGQAFTAGLCISPEVPGNDWAVESLFF